MIVAPEPKFGAHEEGPLKAFLGVLLFAAGFAGAIDTAKLDELGLKVEQTMVSGDPGFLYRAIDQDTLIQRIKALGPIDQTPEQMKTYVDDLLKSEVVDTLKAMGENGYYDYVGHCEKDGQLYATFRISTGTDKYSYHQFAVVEKDGKVMFADRFMIQMDALFSTMYFYDASFQKENGLEIILGGPVSDDEKTKIMGFLESMNDKNPKTAIDAFEKMPEAARKLPFLLAAYFSAATAEGIEATEKALTNYRAFHPSSITVLRHSISFHATRKNYDKAITALDALNKKICGDAWLTLQKAVYYERAGNMEKAREMALQAIDEDKHLSEAYDTLGGYFIKAKEWDQAVGIYSRLEAVFGGRIPISTFFENPENREFRNSSAFKKWKKTEIYEYKSAELCSYVEQHMKQGNLNTLVDNFDIDTFRQRMLDAGADEELLDKAGFSKTNLRAKLREAYESLLSAESYRFLNLLRRDGKLYGIFQVMASQNQLNYHEFEMVEVEGKAKFADMYDFILGHNYSWFNAHIEALTRPNNSPLVNQLLGSSLDETLATSVADYIGLLNTGKFAEAGAKWEALPEPIRKDGAIVSGLLVSARTPDNVAKSIAYLEENKGPETTLNLIRLGHALNNSDWESTLEPLELLEKRVGGDPMLTRIKSLTYMQLGDTEKSRDLAVQLVNQEPDNQDHYNTLANILLSSGDFANAVKVFQSAEQRFGELDLEQFKSSPAMKDFIASEAFKAWEAQRKTAGE